MIDARAMAWRHLFAAGTAFTTESGPEYFRHAIDMLGTGQQDQVLVSWGQAPQELPDLSARSGIVAINSRGLKPRHLQAAGFTYVRRFAVLPRLDDARWFIPLGNAGVSAAAFRLYSPYRAVARLKHHGVRVAARSGLPVWYLDHVIVAQRSAPPLELALRSALI
ncbi:MAG TPA: hypothetical protein VM450_06840, partial [Thermomicrobiales bacterium]|nr:hypothetical protein [Thermomicrobiales bacterium]